MIEWNKMQPVEGVILPSNTVYILPYEEGVQIVYNGEVCKIENIGVQEFVDVFKTLEDPSSFKTDFKSTIERVVNHLVLPQKHATT